MKLKAIKTKAQMRNSLPDHQPYSIEQVLSNLREFDRQLSKFAPNLDGGSGYVRGLVQSILDRGIEDRKADLLAALVEMFALNLRSDNFNEEIRQEMLTKARAAIARARGEN